MLLLPHRHSSEGQDFDSVHLLIFPCELEVTVVYMWNYIYSCVKNMHAITVIILSVSCHELLYRICR